MNGVKEVDGYRRRRFRSKVPDFRLPILPASLAVDVDVCRRTLSRASTLLLDELEALRVPDGLDTGLAEGDGIVGEGFCWCPLCRLPE